MWIGGRDGTETQGEKTVKNKMYLNPFEQNRAEINLDDCKLGLVKHCSRTENETQFNSLKDFTECRQEFNEDIREYAARIIRIGKEILSSCPDEKINDIMKNQFALGLNDLTARKIVLEKILKYRQSNKHLSLNDLVDKLTIREIAINSINKAEERKNFQEELKNIKLTPKLGKTVRINEDRELSREVPFSTEWTDESVTRELEQTTESPSYIYPNYRNNYNNNNSGSGNINNDYEYRRQNRYNRSRSGDNNRNFRNGRYSRYDNNNIGNNSGGFNNFYNNPYNNSTPNNNNFLNNKNNIPNNNNNNLHNNNNNMPNNNNNKQKEIITNKINNTDNNKNKINNINEKGKNQTEICVDDADSGDLIMGLAIFNNSLVDYMLDTGAGVTIIGSQLYEKIEEECPGSKLDNTIVS